VSDFDVIVVGGGVIGLSAAWRMAQRDLTVVVLERGEPGGGTSSVAAGMVAPIAEADPGEEALLRLGTASAQAYPRFVAELEAASGRDAGYLPCGTLAAARDRDEAEELEHQLEIRARLGLDVKRLRPSQARALEPGLAPTLRGALAFPGDHAVDPRRLTAALAQALTAAGGQLRAHSEVTSLELAGGTVRGVALSGGERLTAAHVMIAAGVWSAALAGLPESARIPLRPVKGQILRLHDPAGAGLLTRVLRMPAAYVVPRGDGRYVLGATMEERGFDTTVTAGAMFELLRDATELLPGISELVIDELSAGLRPGTPDNAPVIGPGVLPGLHWATGHYRHGILLAPLSAEMAADALEGDAVPEEFSALRFASVGAGVK
jgi:glycine oxidase